MKEIINLLSSPFIKLFKGLVALLFINVLLFTGIFMFQSCQKENVFSETNKKELATQNFENLVKESIPKIQNILENSELKISLNSSKMDERQAAAEEEFKNALLPLINGGTELLLAYGLSRSELEESFGDLRDPGIAIAAISILTAEINRNNMAVNHPNFFIFSGYAQDEWYDCLLRSVGIDAVIELFNKKVTKTIALKVVRKVASRTVGWVGAGIAVYEFGRCMDWY